MENELIAHHWAPVSDLADRDRQAASAELPALARTWEDVRQQLDRVHLDRFNERLVREWAIETGIVERIYTLAQSTTQQLIEQGIDSSLIAHDASDQAPELVAGIIQDHSETLEWLLEIASEQRPLSTEFVQELHASMTREQRFAAKFDPTTHTHHSNSQHSSYKQRPNNSIGSDGKEHQYCPPEQVAEEMDRLIELHQSHRVAGVAPDVSAAWLHHRFMQIQPFQDGNGLVACAIASLVLMNAGWLPLLVSREDRNRYVGALGDADNGDLVPLTSLISKLQRKQLIRALSIAEEAKSQDQRLDQVLEVISDMFNGASTPANQALQRVCDTAERLWESCADLFDDTSKKLELSLGDSLARQVWFDFGNNSNAKRRTWNRYQIVQTARELEYFANTRDYHEWVRLGIMTENGRSEILTSFHGIGKVFRGLIGVSMCFYRRQQADDVEQQIIELQPVSDDLFQINYEEPYESVEKRFVDWLEKSLVVALDQWRRGE